MPIVRPSILALALALGFPMVASMMAAREASAQFCSNCQSATVVELGDTPFKGSATGCFIPGAMGGCLQPSNNTSFFSFTPPVSGPYRISTCTAAVGGSLTVLSVWTECSEFALATCALAGCPSGGGAGSLIGSIDLEQGVNYRISIGANCCTDDFIESGVLTIERIDAPGTGCAEAGTAVVGLNAFDTSDRNEIVDLEGFCDPIPQGGTWDDRLHNVAYFRFTPPQSAVYSITTCGIVPFGTRVAVLNGCSPKSGVLGCTDGTCAPGQSYGSRVIGVSLAGGVEYTILIGGIGGGDSGVGQFEISPFETCEPPAPTRVEIEACGEDLNAGCESSSRPAEPIEVGDSVRGSVWTGGGARDTDWYVLNLLEGTEVSLALYSNIDSSATFYFADCSTSFFMDRTGFGCPGTTDGICLAPGQYYIAVEPNQFWNHPCGYPAGNEYTLVVTGVPCDTTPPANDFCGQAQVVSQGSTPFDNYFATTETLPQICPAPVLLDVWFRFTATQTGNHRIRTCQGEQPFNTGIDVWTDCPDFGGVPVACNDDANDPECGPVSSTVITPLAAGQTVLIRVGSTFFFDALPGASELVIEFLGDQVVCGDPDAGDCCSTKSTPVCADAECCNSVCAWDPTCCSAAWDRVCVSTAAFWCFASCAAQPANDDCGSAIAADVGLNEFRNNQSTGSIESPCGVVYSDVWFTYTAKSDRPVTISLCDADGGWAYLTGGTDEFDTVIAVFDTCGGVPIACSGDACGTRSRVTFAPACGSTYTIAIGSRTSSDGIYSQGVGAFAILQDGVCGAACPADLTGDGEVAAQDLAALLSAWGESGGDVNGDGTTNAQDLAALLAAWGICG